MDLQELKNELENAIDQVADAQNLVEAIMEQAGINTTLQMLTI